MDKKSVKKMKLGDEKVQADLAYWMNRPAEERIATVEALRREHYGSSARLQGIVHIIKSTQG